MNSRPDTTDTTVRMRTMEVEGLNLFYREAGKPSRPKLVLLHGFPASSHQYRNLIPVLADTFHVMAMDYPGFGNSDMPDPARLCRKCGSGGYDGAVAPVCVGLTPRGSRTIRPQCGPRLFPRPAVVFS